VILLEPESILGASFQLSFAAVAALVAVQEARVVAARRGTSVTKLLDRKDKLLVALDRARTGPIRLLATTICATSATAAFMAYEFHEVSPYVVISNPLTLAVIELFAVPCALLGTLLYPFGLDAFVWRYLGAGIDFILWAASRIAGAPNSSIPLPAFAPWALASFAFGLVGLAIWRTGWMRFAMTPFLVLGLFGAAQTAGRWDVDVAPAGDAVAVRDFEHRLVVVGRRPSAFDVEQWLRADGDLRPAAAAIVGPFGDSTRGVGCDPLGCVAGRPEATIALVLDPAAFAEDCNRADVVVSPLVGPPTCAARLLLDRRALQRTGAVALRFDDSRIAMASARPARIVPGRRRLARRRRA
jgi:competence protein ComEC